MRALPPLLVLLVGLAACGEKTQVDPNAPCCDVGSTGAISEAEFKALHELSAAEVPPLKGETVQVGATQAYLSLPKGHKPPLPGVILVHEWWGLNDHIRHWADRLAAEGFAALAVDLYGGKVATNPDDALAAMQAVDVAAARQVLQQAYDFLGTEPRTLSTLRASMGWCFGGSMSLQAALTLPGLDACVVYYGRPVLVAAELAKIKAPLLGIFATRDRSIPAETVDAFDRALTEAGVKHEIKRFDAEHAFANPSSGRYDEKSAEAAWRAARVFLRARLLPDPTAH